MTVSHVLIQDHEHRHGEFHQLAYHRFFIMLLNDLGAPDPVFEAINFPVLHSFRYVAMSIYVPCGMYMFVLHEFIFKTVLIMDVLSFQACFPHHSPQPSSWICLLLAWVDISSNIHLEASAPDSPAEGAYCVWSMDWILLVIAFFFLLGLAIVSSAIDWFVQVSCSFSTQCWTYQANAVVIQSECVYI